MSTFDRNDVCLLCHEPRVDHEHRDGNWLCPSMSVSIGPGSLAEAYGVLREVRTKRDQRTYLGDSVYVSVESGMLKLTTWNGFGDSNTIFLEPEVYQALERFVGSLRFSGGQFAR